MLAVVATWQLLETRTHFACDAYALRRSWASSCLFDLPLVWDLLFLHLVADLASWGLSIAVFRLPRNLRESVRFGGALRLDPLPSSQGLLWLGSIPSITQATEALLFF